MKHEQLRVQARGASTSEDTEVFRGKGGAPAKLKKREREFDDPRGRISPLLEKEGTSLGQDERQTASSKGNQ